jgi:hypothetical protein
MATTKSVKRKLTEKIEKVSGFQNVVPGRIGATSTLIETGIPGLIYVRIEGSGQVVTAVNTVAPSEYNHPVLLARSKANKKLWEVIASRQAYTVPVNRDLRYHHSQHEHPNPDTVWVKGDQFLPFLVTPDTGFVVKIFGGVVTLGGTRYLVGNQSLDLSSLQPAVGAVWVLIEVTSAGAIDTVTSTEYDNKELLTPDLIPLPGAGAWDICAVRLYGGQESLQRGVINDFVDLRFGKPGGSDIVTIAFLDDIGDVNAPSPTDGQVLTWDAYAEEWVAADPSGSFDIHALTEKTTIADEDEFPLADSAAGFAQKKVKWSTAITEVFHDALGEIVELEDDFATGADGWTLGTGWAHDAGNEWVEHTPGSTDPLSYPGSPIDEAVYWLLVNVGGTTGTVTARVDAAGGASVIPAGAGTVMVACKSSGGSTKIMIVPSSDFDGYISSVTVLRAPLIQDALPDSAVYARQDYDWVPLDMVFQPLDSDLTAIAALTPTNDDVLQRKAGAWVNRTIAQLITDLTTGLSALFAPIAKGVTNGDSHDHVGGDGAQIAYSGLSGLPTLREVLTGNRTYYVRTDGSDSNNGLANTAGGAFLTVQKAIDTAIALDLSLYSVTIQVADGTYTGALTLKPYTGTGPIYIIGNTTTPANAVISTTSANCVTAQPFARQWNIKGFKFITTTAGDCILSQRGAKIVIDGAVEFGACAGTAHLYHIGGDIEVASNYTISGGAVIHILTSGGYFSANGITTTLTGTPAFSYFAYAAGISNLQHAGGTFSGAATGKRYNAIQNSLINTNGGGANYFPGDAAGDAPTSGGQYV